MSFNIRYGLADDGDHHWQRRKTLALARIQAFAPDLLGLQECRDDEQAAFVRHSLADYQFHGVPRDGGDDTGLEMAPLLFRRDRFELLRDGHFWLSDTPAVAGSRSWDTAFARTASWVALRERASGRELVFVNTHFDYELAAVNGAAQLLHDWLAGLDRTLPIIATGDFNAEKASDAYRLLTARSRLADAYRAAHPDAGGGDEITYHGYGRAEDAGALDWILVSEHFRVSDATIDRSREAGRFPSDHYPVTAVLEWGI